MKTAVQFVLLLISTCALWFFIDATNYKAGICLFVILWTENIQRRIAERD